MPDMDAIATNPPRSDQPYGQPVVPAPEGLLWTKWRALSANIASDMQPLARYRAEPERALLLDNDRQLASFEPLFLSREAGLQQDGRSAPAGTFSLAERLAGRGAAGLSYAIETA
jgi:hypothetical protein